MFKKISGHFTLAVILLLMLPPPGGNAQSAPGVLTRGLTSSREISVHHTGEACKYLEAAGARSAWAWARPFAMPETCQWITLGCQMQTILSYRKISIE